MNKFAETWLKGLKWFVIFFLPIMTIGFIVVPVLDKFFPWTMAEEEIRRQGNTGFPLCVGAFYESEGSRTVCKQRSYILIPSILVKPRIIHVTEFDRNQLEIGETLVGFVLYVIFLVGVLGTTFAYAVPQIMRSAKGIWKKS
jgi:hypothetical protein